MSGVGIVAVIVLLAITVGAIVAVIMVLHYGSRHSCHHVAVYLAGVFISV